LSHIKNISSHLVKVRAHTPKTLHTAAAAKSSAKLPTTRDPSHRYRFPSARNHQLQLRGLANRAKSFGKASALKTKQGPTSRSSPVSEMVAGGFGAPMMLGMAFMAWPNFLRGNKKPKQLSPPSENSSNAIAKNDPKGTEIEKPTGQNAPVESTALTVTPKLEKRLPLMLRFSIRLGRTRFGRLLDPLMSSRFMVRLTLLMPGFDRHFRKWKTEVISLTTEPFENNSIDLNATQFFDGAIIVFEKALAIPSFALSLPLDALVFSAKLILGKDRVPIESGRFLKKSRAMLLQKPEFGLNEWKRSQRILKKVRRSRGEKGSSLNLDLYKSCQKISEDSGLSFELVLARALKDASPQVTELWMDHHFQDDLAGRMEWIKKGRVKGGFEFITTLIKLGDLTWREISWSLGILGYLKAEEALSIFENLKPSLSKRYEFLLSTTETRIDRLESILIKMVDRKDGYYQHLTGEVSEHEINAALQIIRKRTNRPSIEPAMIVGTHGYLQEAKSHLQRFQDWPDLTPSDKLHLANAYFELGFKEDSLAIVKKLLSDPDVDFGAAQLMDKLQPGWDDFIPRIGTKQLGPYR